MGSWNGIGSWNGNGIKNGNGNGKGNRKHNGIPFQEDDSKISPSPFSRQGQAYSLQGHPPHDI